MFDLGRLGFEIPAESNNKHFPERIFFFKKKIYLFCHENYGAYLEGGSEEEACEASKY